MELGVVEQSGEWEENDDEEGGGYFEPESLAVVRAKVLLGQTGGVRTCKRCHQSGHNSIECRADWGKIKHAVLPFQQPPRK